MVVGPSEVDVPTEYQDMYIYHTELLNYPEVKNGITNYTTNCTVIVDCPTSLVKKYMREKYPLESSDDEDNVMKTPKGSLRNKKQINTQLLIEIF